MSDFEHTMIQVRDLLLWQDVYVWEGLGGAGGVSSSQVGFQTDKVLINVHEITQIENLPAFTSVSFQHDSSTFKGFMFNIIQGSREGSESGEGILADEIDKLQVS